MPVVADIGKENMRSVAPEKKQDENFANDWKTHH